MKHRTNVEQWHHRRRFRSAVTFTGVNRMWTEARTRSQQTSTPVPVTAATA